MPEKPAFRGKVLVVEDEAYVRDSLAKLLRARGFDVVLADGLEAALARVGKMPMDLVLTDLKMPGGGGLEVVKRVRETSPGTPVVVLTGFGTVTSAVECLKAGAADYILKPADPDALEVAFQRAMKHRALELEVDYLRGPAGDANALPIGPSAAWQRVLKLVRAAAASDAPVLLLGESGTGKQLLARLVHRLSARAEGPFIRLDCPGVPAEEWDSELLGPRRGAATGKMSGREGRLRLAHGGTLFLDEVAAVPTEAQVKLLQVLQGGQFQRLGDEQPTRVDVRIVAATNADLAAEVAGGRFRQDVYFRLNVLPIAVPSLRERVEDIAPLAQHLVAEIAAQAGAKPPALKPETLAELQAYHWPGNVRELRNVLERSMILDPDGGLSNLDLSPVRAAAVSSPRSAGEDDLNLRSALGRTERAMIVEALRRSEGVRKEASRLLGIDQRNLGYYLKKHDIDPDAPA